MATRLVQYRVKPDRIAENERLVRDVLAQLGERRVSDVRYAVLRGSDGTFTHIVESDANGSAAALTSLPAFKRFQEGTAERTNLAPKTDEVVLIGNHLMLAGTAEDG
jgi:hypothetical protein